MSLIYTIRDLMNSDDEDDSDRLINLYRKSTSYEQVLIDKVLVCICGYGMRSLEKLSHDDYSDDEPWDLDGNDGDALASAGHGTDEDYGSASEML